MCCRFWIRISVAGVAGSPALGSVICGPMAGDLRLGGSAGGGINGSEMGSGDTES